MSAHKVLCLVAAVLLGAAMVAEATPRSLLDTISGNALDNGTPNDAVWICSVYYSGEPSYGECGGAKAKNAFLTLAKSVIPSSSLNISTIQMLGVSVGCCFQVDILNTYANSTASDKAFSFMSNAKTGLNSATVQTGIKAWAKKWGVCGPSAAIDFLVGWDIYSPIKVKYFGCNIGTLGTKLATMCKC